MEVIGIQVGKGSTKLAVRKLNTTTPHRLINFPSVAVPVVGQDVYGVSERTTVDVPGHGKYLVGLDAQEMQRMTTVAHDTGRYTRPDITAMIMHGLASLEVTGKALIATSVPGAWFSTDRQTELRGQITQALPKGIQMVDLLCTPEGAAPAYDWIFSTGADVTERLKTLSATIDVGNGDINWAVFDNGRPSQTQSETAGVSRTTRTIQQCLLRADWPEYTLAEVDQIVRNGGAYLSGAWEPLPPAVHDIIMTGAVDVEQRIRNLPGGAARFKVIIGAGGGMYLYGAHLTSVFPAFQITHMPTKAVSWADAMRVAQPEFAGVRGLTAIGQQKALALTKGS